MKNTKLIALVAVLVVITLVVSIVVATSNDKKVSDDLKQTVTDYESKIDALNKVIDELNKGLISAEEALEALNKAGVELKEWNEATVALPQKLIDLENAYKAFRNSAVVINPTYKGEIKKDSEGLVVETESYVLVTFAQLYGYEVNGEVVAEQFNELYQEAYNDILRSTTVEEMTGVVTGFTASCEAVPTAIEALRTAIETAENGGVTYDDYANIKLAKYLLKDYAVDDDLYNKDEKKDLSERLVALYKDIRPIAVESFQTLAEALPRVEMVAPSHYEQIEAAEDELDFVMEIYTELYGAQAQAEFNKLLLKATGKPTVFGKANTHFEQVCARRDEVKVIETRANSVNEVLAKAFTKDNVDGWVLTNYGANLATHNYIYTTLSGHIEYWETFNSIVTDEKDEDFNEELYNLVDRDMYAGYVADFQVVIAELREKADAFIDAVAAIEKITPDSAAELNAAKALYDIANSIMPVADLDTILNYVDYEDEDGDWIEITGMIDSNTILNNLAHKYVVLMNAIKTIEDTVDGCLIKCPFTNVPAGTHGTHQYTNQVIPCDCKNLGELDTTKVEATNFATLDALMVMILGDYDLDETVIKAELLAKYKEARVHNEVKAALTRLETAFAAATIANADGVKALAEVQIKAAATNYTFAVKFVCADPDNAAHTEHTSACKYEMDIANDPVKTLQKNYSAAACADLFLCQHDVMTSVEAKAPTCDQPGYTAHKVCQCGHTEGYTVVPATGAHSYDATTGICGGCGATDPNFVPNP